MNRKVLHTLEYDKIIEMLVREADSDPGRDKAGRIVPLSRRDDIIARRRPPLPATGS